jgi:ADP-ribose pyrophosphatase YjhB (NUDIX family)
MYVTSQLVKDFEDSYGNPAILTAEFVMNPDEFTFLKKSRKFERSHDITFFIRKDDKWIVNSKHWYPRGLYRIPSGGANPGETVEEGTRREAYEETGCEIEILKYFLRIGVRFLCGEEHEDWVSHLVLCRWAAGVLKPIDKREIKEVVLAGPEDFDNFTKIMLSLKVGGLHYREFLQRNAFKVLAEAGY